jgi:hypothetical protein
MNFDDGQLEAVYLNHLTFSWGVHEGEGGQEPLSFAGEHGNPRQGQPLIALSTLLQIQWLVQVLRY